MQMNPLRVLSVPIFAVLIAATAAAAAPMVEEPLSSDGVVQVRSAYPLDQTIDRIKEDIESKGIMLFSAIDQSKLAADAGVPLHASTLLVFGNPALGAQFITSNAVAGLDWPVRLLVYQDDAGAVWAAYTDFSWIARRHHIGNRDAAFSKATGVIASVASSISPR